MSNDLNTALQQFDATEANLMKLEQLWIEIEKLVLSGVLFLTPTPQARRYEDMSQAFCNILKHMPSIGEYRICDHLLDLTVAIQIVIGTSQYETIKGSKSVKQLISKQRENLQEYRYRFDAKRRELVREPILKLIDEVDSDIRQLQPIADDIEKKESRMLQEKMTGVMWDKFIHHIAQIGTLVGSRFPRIKGWGDLQRHIHYHELQDFRNIQQSDWPAVKKGLYEIIYGENAPVRVEANDLSDLVAAKPSGPVVTKLNWAKIGDDEFERLIYCLNVCLQHAPILLLSLNLGNFLKSSKDTQHFLIKRIPFW